MIGAAGGKAVNSRLGRLPVPAARRRRGRRRGGSAGRRPGAAAAGRWCRRIPSARRRRGGRGGCGAGCPGAARGYARTPPGGARCRECRRLSRIASVPSRQECSSARKMSTKVALSMAVDMLGVKGNAGGFQGRGDAGVHRAQPRDRGEQAEAAACGRLEQRPEGAGQASRVSAMLTSLTMQMRGLRGVVEGRGEGGADRRRGQMHGAGAGFGTLPTPPRCPARRAAWRR